MSKLLYVFEREMPTVSIIRENNRKQYAGTDVAWKMLPAWEVRPSDIEEADSVILIRPNSSLILGIAKKAKKSGCFLSVLCDDDLLRLPKGIPDIPHRRRMLRRCLAVSDMVVSSSPYIAEEYGELTAGKRGFVSHTVVDGGFMREPVAPQTGALKLVYAAGADHVTLFNEIILPVLPRLAERYGDRLSLTLVGLNPNLDEAKKYLRVRHEGFRPLLDYRRYMRSEGFTLGLAPLHDTAFCHRKYFNKFIEYTLVGTAGVYSDQKPFTYVVRDGENGYLAKNTPEAWYAAICRALDDAEERERCLKNAQALLLRDFSADRLLSAAREAMPELYQTRTVRRRVPTLFWDRLFYLVTRLGDWAYLTVFHLNRSGVSGLLRQIREHLRRQEA